MKLTGPDAVPPPSSSSTRRADLRQVDTGTGAALEDDALLAVPVEDRAHLVVDRQDEAGARLLRDVLDADVEPHRAVERGALRDEDVLQLVAEGLGLVLVGEVVALAAPLDDRVDDPVDHLAQRVLALGRAERAAEVLLGDDVGGVDRPGRGELDVELLERDRAVLPVGDPCVTALPHDLVVRVDTRRGEEPSKAQRPDAVRPVADSRSGARDMCDSFQSDERRAAVRRRHKM